MDFGPKKGRRQQNEGLRGGNGGWRMAKAWKRAWSPWMKLARKLCCLFVVAALFDSAIGIGASSPADTEPAAFPNIFADLLALTFGISQLNIFLRIF